MTKTLAKILEKKQMTLNDFNISTNEADIYLYVFDSSKIEDVNYGEKINDLILKDLYTSEVTTHIYVGDYINNLNHIYADEFKYFLLDKQYDILHPSSLYLVLLIRNEDNNLFTSIASEKSLICKKKIEKKDLLLSYILTILFLKFVIKDKVVLSNFAEDHYDIMESVAQVDGKFDYSVINIKFDNFSFLNKLEQNVVKYSDYAYIMCAKKIYSESNSTDVAGDNKFSNEREEVYFIQNLFIESKNILSNLTLQNDMEIFIKFGGNDYIRYLEINIDRIFYLHQQLFERLFKLIYIKERNIEPKSSNNQLREFGHNINKLKLVSELSSLFKKLDEDEHEYLDIIFEYYNMMRYDTFKDNPNVEYFDKKFKFLNKHGMEFRNDYPLNKIFIESYGIEFNIKFNVFIDNLYKKIVYTYIDCLEKKEIFYANELFYPTFNLENQILNKLVYSSIECEFSNNENSLLYDLHDDIYSQVDDLVGLEKISHIRYLLYEKYYDILERYDVKNIEMYNLIEAIIDNIYIVKGVDDNDNIVIENLD